MKFLKWLLSFFIRPEPVKPPCSAKRRDGHLEYLHQKYASGYHIPEAVLNKKWGGKYNDLC